MTQRFKDKSLNSTYWLWVKMPEERILDLLNIGSSRDQAFKEGYLGQRCKYQRNWRLYAIYVAGKEWRRINKKDIQIKN